jgi:chitin disaccharide deacetylase
MKTRTTLKTIGGGLGVVLLAAAAIGLCAQPKASPDGTIRLIVRGDDIGSSHAANLACIQSFRDGIVRSVEVMVPAPWFPEAVRMLRDNPGLDVGVHLTLTSEWDNCKWRPLTGPSSITDADGYFFPTNAQRKDFAPNTGFLDANPKAEDVEKELRAQIELARRLIPQVTHLSAHMGTPVIRPDLRQLTQRLAAEYKLPLELPLAVRPIGHWGQTAKTPAQKEAALAELLEKLTGGDWYFVEHPGLDTPEMQALGHKGYEDVAADRQGVTAAFTSPKVKQVVADRGIRLISYGEYYRSAEKR